MSPIMQFSSSLLPLLVLLLSRVGWIEAHSTPIPYSYIVRLNIHEDLRAGASSASSASISSHYAWLRSLLDEAGGASSAGLRLVGKKAGVVHTYSVANFNGYSGVFPDDVIEKIRERPEVAVVERDSLASVASPVGRKNPYRKQAKTAGSGKPQVQKPTCVNQTLGLDGEWGLGRISHYNRYPSPNVGWSNYTYSNDTGTCPSATPGGTAYVVDSGILWTHPDFAGRAMYGFSSDSTWPTNDVCGHGTHVAGTIGGTKYGVMKNARLVSVKVLEGKDMACNGPWSGVMAGIQWSYHDAKSSGRLATSVLNLSLGGQLNGLVNDLVAETIKNGLTTVVAAGNFYSSDACYYTPSAVKTAITVGATNILDEIASFSNIGCCVDIYAPGDMIRSAYLGNGSKILSGTSMATPFVTGVVLHNKCRYGFSTPAQDRSGVVNYSIKNAIPKFTTCRETNKIVYNRGCSAEKPRPKSLSRNNH